MRVLDADGTEVPAHVEDDGWSVTWLARDVPSLGWRAYRFVPGGAPSGPAAGWQPVGGFGISNEHYRLAVDAARGGGVSSLVQDGRELIADGRVGNELAVYEEYPSHPTQGEGPWQLLPKGPVVCSSESPAQVQAYHGPLGQRLVVRGAIGAAAALHPDTDPVARPGAGGLPHHHRRVHRGRPLGAAALAVSGAGRDAGQ